jgi:hypothetical protein
MWAALKKGLNFQDRYLLMQCAYRDRRMKNYPLLSSMAYARNYGLFRAISEVRQVPGEVVECGVGRGLSLAPLVYAVALFQLDKIVYAFDSFAGFPAATPDDIGGRVEETGVAPAGWSDTSPELIRSILEQDRSDGDSLLQGRNVPLEIVRGYFEDTMPGHLPASIAFLHVDCDLYQSIRVVLEYALPRVSPGGLVIFDEYHDALWPGAKKAADEACAARGYAIQYFPAIQRFGIRVPTTLQ